MLTEKLKQIVAEYNAPNPDTPIWKFVDGNNEWQNLGDYPEDQNEAWEVRKKYLLLLWKDREHQMGEYSSVNGYSFSGEMIISVRSKISDPTYNYKYETHIKNLYAESERLMNMASDCGGFVVKRWKDTEVVDMYDTNMDGLKISFTLEYTF